MNISPPILSAFSTITLQNMQSVVSMQTQWININHTPKRMHILTFNVSPATYVFFDISIYKMSIGEDVYK